MGRCYVFKVFVSETQVSSKPLVEPIRLTLRLKHPNILFCQSRNDTVRNFPKN